MTYSIYLPYQRADFLYFDSEYDNFVTLWYNYNLPDFITTRFLISKIYWQQMFWLKLHFTLIIESFWSFIMKNGFEKKTLDFHTSQNVSDLRLLSFKQISHLRNQGKRELGTEKKLGVGFSKGKSRKVSRRESQSFILKTSNF